jgi:hypothetical protein
MAKEKTAQICIMTDTGNAELTKAAGFGETTPALPALTGTILYYQKTIIV